MKTIVVDADLLKDLKPNEFYMYAALKDAVLASKDGVVDCYEVNTPKLTEKQKITAIQALERKGLISRKACTLNTPVEKTEKIEEKSEKKLELPIKEKFSAVAQKEESEEEQAARIHREALEYKKKQSEKDAARVDKEAALRERASKRNEIIETIYKLEGGDLNEIVRMVDNNLNGTEEDNKFLDTMLEKVREADRQERNKNNPSDDDIIAEIFSADMSD